MRKFVIAVVLMVGVIYVLARFSEIEEIARTLQEADWRYILGAVVMLVVWMIIMALNYWAIYRALGINEKLTHIAMTAQAANFANIVAPSAGMSGVAVFISEARRKGISSGRVTVAQVLYVVLDYIALLAVLALGLIVLIRRSTLTIVELTPTVYLVLITGLFSYLLFQGMKSDQALGKVLAFMARGINRISRPFIHREYLSEHRAYSFAQEASAGLYRFRHQPRNLIIPAFLALTGKVCLIIIFWLIFLAFQIPYSPGTIIAGFSIGSLFMLVSPTPAGIGVVEAALPLLLATMYVPLHAGTVITIAYRAITFWLPLLVGMVAFRWLGRAEKSTVIASTVKQ